MLQKNMSTIVMGTVLGTVIGSLSALALPKNTRFLSLFKENKDWLGRTKGFQEGFLARNKTESTGFPFFSGALLGLAIGTGSAFLISPRVSRQLRTNITKTYQDVSEKAHDFVDMVNHYSFNHQPQKKKATPRRPAKSRVRAASPSAKKTTFHSKRPKSQTSPRSSQRSTSQTKSISAI